MPKRAAAAARAAWVRVSPTPTRLASAPAVGDRFLLLTLTACCVAVLLRAEPLPALNFVLAPPAPATAAAAAVSLLRRRWRAATAAATFLACIAGTFHKRYAGRTRDVAALAFRAVFFPVLSRALSSTCITLHVLPEPVSTMGWLAFARTRFLAPGLVAVATASAALPGAQFRLLVAMQGAFMLALQPRACTAAETCTFRGSRPYFEATARGAASMAAALGGAIIGGAPGAARPRAAVCADRACFLTSGVILAAALGGAVWVADPSPRRPPLLAAVVAWLGLVAAALALDARLPCAGGRL